LDIARDDRHAGELLLRLEQRRHVALAEAQCIRQDEAQMHGFADDRRHPHRLGEMRVVAQILRRVRQREPQARQVAAFEHAPDEHLEQPGVHGARGNDLVQLSNRQARLRRGRARFRGRRADRLRDEVVDELQDDAVTGRACMDDVLAERRERRPKLRERFVVRSDDDIEPSLLRLERRAGERRVDKAHVLLGEELAHARGRRRLARRCVDDDQARARGARDPLRAEHELFHLGRARHAQDHDVAVARKLGRAGRFRGAGGEEVVGRSAVAMQQQRERMPVGE
jgi:hypothetical protein